MSDMPLSIVGNSGKGKEKAKDIINTKPVSAFTPEAL